MTVLLSENIEAQDWMGVNVLNTPNQFYTPTLPYAIQGNTWWQGIIWYVDQSTTDASWNLPSFLNRPTGNVAAGAELLIAKPSSNHPGGFLMTMCDGHTVFISEDIEYRVYALVMAPDSGNAKMPGTTNWPYNMPTPAGPTVGAWKDATTRGLNPIFEADLTK